MDELRFQPPGCPVWVVWSDSAPPQGQFTWSTSEEDARPFQPELHVPRFIGRAEAFRLAVECQTRWKWVLRSYEEKLRQKELDRQRELQAQARWADIQAQWEETRRRAANKSKEARGPRGQPGPRTDLPAPPIPPPILALGLGWPCTEEDVKRAFREKVKTAHPDRGGTESGFIELRRRYEEALELFGKG